jgi:regulator of RNase E activity RraA
MLFFSLENQALFDQKGVTATMTNDFATCDLCDVHKDDTTGEFRVLAPVFRDFGAVKSFRGPVQTVKCFEDNSAGQSGSGFTGYLETPARPCGKVLVVDGGGLACAGRCWGATWVLPRRATVGPVW